MDLSLCIDKDRRTDRWVPSHDDDDNPPPLIADWVDVANDLLSKCNLTLRLRTLGDCHAAVFIALYENILGETVPGKCIYWFKKSNKKHKPCSQEQQHINSMLQSSAKKSEK